MKATVGASRSARTLPRLGLLTLLIAASLTAMPASAADPTAVTGAQIGTSADVTVVRIALTSTGGASPTVSPFRQTNPERLVLDIAGATLAEGAKAPSGGIVTRSEFSTFNDGTDNVRLTLFLSGPATWDVQTEGGTVVLTLTPGAVSDPLAEALGGGGGEGQPKLSGPLAPTTGPSLTSLDFQQKDKVSRVLIGVQDSEPAVSQPERNLIAVDLPGATVPDSLRRELNTRFFYSAVDSVRATPTRAGARVLIRLREGAEYTVSREGGLFVLDVTIPADLVAQRDAALQQAASAAPATPETNGTEPKTNAKGQQETLITSGGKAVDPQAVFGTGGGSSQPGAFSFAQDMQGATASRSSARRISIDLQDADIHMVFRFIADFADINIITSDDVQGKVTVRLKDVPWDEALGAILQAKGLGAQRFGNIVRVAPIETIKSEQQAALEAQRAAADLEELAVYVAPLNYAQASEVTEQVQSVLSSRGSLQVDTHGNQLIIRDAEDRIAQVRELMRALDRPNRQVSIEARFVEATASFTRALGIQWGGSLDASAGTGYPTGAFFPNSIQASGGTDTQTGLALFTPDAESLLVDMGATGATSSMAISLGSIPGLIDLNARLSALENEGWGKVISSPRVTALDNEEATVIQGARVPYVSQTGLGAANVQFVQANLELSVTPHITAEGTVFLDINITNDRPDFSQSVDNNPTILTKAIETRVLVPDGDTTVLGGVYSTTDSFSQDRVPGLGSIPLIGYLFRNSTKSHTQQEMLVFITPRIVPLESRRGGTAQ